MIFFLCVFIYDKTKVHVTQWHTDPNWTTNELSWMLAILHKTLISKTFIIYVSSYFVSLWLVRVIKNDFSLKFCEFLV